MNDERESEEHLQRVEHAFQEHDETRHLVSGFICDASYRGWTAFAERYGVTITALLDAVGHQMSADAELSPTHLEIAAPLKSAVIEAGRRIDALRRKRR